MRPVTHYHEQTKISVCTFEQKASTRHYKIDKQALPEYGQAWHFRARFAGAATLLELPGKTSTLPPTTSMFVMVKLVTS